MEVVSKKLDENGMGIYLYYIYMSYMYTVSYIYTVYAIYNYVYIIYKCISSI